MREGREARQRERVGQRCATTHHCAEPADGRRLAVAGAQWLLNFGRSANGGLAQPRTDLRNNMMQRRAE